MLVDGLGSLADFSAIIVRTTMYNVEKTRPMYTMSQKVCPLMFDNNFDNVRRFLPCMHSADYAVARYLSVRLSVRPSHAGIVYKRLYRSSKFFHHRVAPPF